METLSLSELENAARRVARMMRNLRADNPRPAWTRTLSLTECAIVCIHGASLIVSYTASDLNCWDILTCRRVAHLEISELYFRTEASVDILGKALIGASVGYVSVALAL